MPECPRPGEGSAEPSRRLLVGTWAYFAENREEKAAMLRLAVRMTNVVTEKLGCGGEPLPPPEDVAVPDTGRRVSRAEARDTACGALAEIDPYRVGGLYASDHFPVIAHMRIG